MRDIEDEILDQLASSCECDIIDDLISNGTLLCHPYFSSFLTYRAFIKGNMALPTMTLISYIEEWLKAGAELQVNGKLLHAQIGCPVAISSVNEVECASYEPSVTQTNTVVISISVSMACLLAVLIIVSITIVAAAIYMLKRRKRASIKESFNK